MTDVRYYELPSSNSIFQKSVNKNNLHTRYGRVKLDFGSRQPLVIQTLTHDDSTLAKDSPANYATVIPDKYLLSQNYPNPFNPLTNFRFELPKDETVHLAVYNVNGQKVKDLINGYREAGIHEVLFDGSKLPSGCIFTVCRLASFQIQNACC